MLPLTLCWRYSSNYQSRGYFPSRSSSYEYRNIPPHHVDDSQSLARGNIVLGNINLNDNASKLSRNENKKDKAEEENLSGNFIIGREVPESEEEEQILKPLHYALRRGYYGSSAFSRDELFNNYNYPGAISNNHGNDHIILQLLDMTTSATLKHNEAIIYDSETTWTDAQKPDRRWRYSIEPLTHVDDIGGTEIDLVIAYTQTPMIVLGEQHLPHLDNNSFIAPKVGDGNNISNSLVGFRQQTIDSICKNACNTTVNATTLPLENTLNIERHNIYDVKAVEDSSLSNVTGEVNAEQININSIILQRNENSKIIENNSTFMNQGEVIQTIYQNERPNALKENETHHETNKNNNVSELSLLYSRIESVARSFCNQRRVHKFEKLLHTDGSFIDLKVSLII